MCKTAQPFASANYKLDWVYMKPPAFARLQHYVFIWVPPSRSFLKIEEEGEIR